MAAERARQKGREGKNISIGSMGRCSLFLLCLAVLVQHCLGAERIEVRSILRQALHRRHARSEPLTSYRFKRQAHAMPMTELDEVLALGREAKLTLVQETMSVQGTKVLKMQEQYKGREILDAIVTLETDHEGHRVLDASGIVYRNIDLDFEQSSQLDAEQAKALCMQFNGDEETPPDKISHASAEEKVFFDKDTEGYRGFLVQYLVSGEGKNHRRPTCQIDARNSSTVFSWDAIETYTDYTAAGVGGNLKIGKIRYGEFHKSLNLRRDNDTCYLENRFVRVLNNNFTYNETDEKKNWTTPVASYNCTEIDDYVNGAYSPLLDALFYGTVVSRMFEDWYSMSPLGEVFTIRVHYGVDKNNAFWNGQECAFGDGDGITMHPLIAIDVVAHEFAHGITERYSKLHYHQQWGGINEAFSDMTGETAEAYLGEADWKVGIDIMVGNKPIRYHDKPEKDGHSISHADNYTDFMDPHYGSGVYNHAFYKLVHDSRLPIRQVYHVFLHANKMYWHHKSDYVHAACGVMKSAYDLGQDGNKFRKAFEEVGVEVCNVEDHVLGLKNKKVYSNITVSRAISPTFVFSVPGHFAESVTVNASSSFGDVYIILSDKKWGLKEETVNEYAKGLHSVTYQLLQNRTLHVTVTLTTESVSSLNDVSLAAAYKCVASFKPGESHILYLNWKYYCADK